MSEKHLVCQGATVYCDKSLACNSPATAVPLNITSQTLVEMNGGKLAATDKDNSVANMNFGICNDPKYSNAKPPCMAKVIWQKMHEEVDITEAGMKFLTEKSEAVCNVCSVPGKIRIAFHGQVATLTADNFNALPKTVQFALCPVSREKENDRIEFGQKDGRLKRFLVKEVKGNTTAHPFEKVIYKVTAYNEPAVPDNVRESIRWMISVDGKEESVSETGETLELLIKSEWTGKDVTVMPYLRKPDDEVSVKTTVKRFPKSILFARSMKKPGKTLTGETAEDMLCADKTPEEVCRMHRLFGLQLKASDRELFADMHMLAGMGSLSGGGELLTALIGHFKGSTGTPFSNAYMDQKLKEHPSFHTFVYQEKEGVLDNLKDQLENVSGNINRLQLPQTGNINSERTKFNTLKDKLNGMTLAVDDTSAYEVYVDDYKLTAPNTFNCNLRIIVYDNYGLDTADIVKYGTMAGFRAWYVLQHVRGYKPFLTKMSCIIPIRNKTF